MGIVQELEVGYVFVRGIFSGAYQTTAPPGLVQFWRSVKESQVKANVLNEAIQINLLFVIQAVINFSTLHSPQFLSLDLPRFSFLFCVYLSPDYLHFHFLHMKVSSLHIWHVHCA